MAYPIIILVNCLHTDTVMLLKNIYIHQYVNVNEENVKEIFLRYLLIVYEQIIVLTLSQYFRLQRLTLSVRPNITEKNVKLYNFKSILKKCRLW